MALKVNTEKAKQKAIEEEIKRKQFSSGRYTTWRPAQGKNKIRILPPWTDQGVNAHQFWREIFIHFGIGPEDNQRTFSCPKKTLPGNASSCPICDQVDKLRKTTDPGDLEVAKSIQAKPRYYSNIIDLDDLTWTKEAINELKAASTPQDFLPQEKNPKVQVFIYGPTILKELLDMYQDDLDICDLQTGRDLILRKEGEGLKTVYRVNAPKPNKAPFSSDDLDDKLIDLDTVLPFKTPLELKCALEGIDPEEAKQLQGKTEEVCKQLSKSTTSSKIENKKRVSVIEEDEDEEEEEEEEEEESEDEDEEEKQVIKSKNKSIEKKRGRGRPPKTTAKKNKNEDENMDNIEELEEELKAALLNN